MLLKHILPGAACLALLAGCASTEPQATAGVKPASVTVALAAADAAIRAGQSDKGIALLKSATVAFPNDKQAWVRMAQLRFDQHSYGDAIVDALEAIERDPEDMQAHSILAVGGLRVATKALADLTHKNNLSGTVRSEAQDLAKLLRARLGDELIPVKKAAVVRQPVRPAAAASASAPAAPPGKASDDPFAGLTK